MVYYFRHGGRCSVGAVALLPVEILVSGLSIDVPPASMHHVSLMRQVSIPKNFVETLNVMFDANPRALAALLSHRRPTDKHTPSGTFPEVTADEVPPTDTLGLLDVINAVLESVAPGKRVATIHGPDGFDGFVIGRDRKPQPIPSAE